MTVRPRRAPVVWFIGMLGLIAGLDAGCAGRDDPTGGDDPTSSGVELAPFIELARKSECANARRRLFVIDDEIVFFDRAGDCPDNSYSETLYAGSVDDVLCTSHDSIAGPVTRCKDAAHDALFETIIMHLEDPDLGLGSRHRVRQVPL